ncbi:uncharacterized protein LOC124929035 [Impatiens glandulifera]|uniref:uncharacterized protein LOC124929035 n=1 Tax=Impatiens glandulifera TaxID=253017 RepID=UPI001FB1776A|nr:uncharacterized protein LOC124929035 [Impatiens glandulifera]
MVEEDDTMFGDVVEVEEGDGGDDEVKAERCTHIFRFCQRILKDLGNHFLLSLRLSTETLRRRPPYIANPTSPLSLRRRHSLSDVATLFLPIPFIGFLSPQVGPDSDGPNLPTLGLDEFRPFVCRLLEFKFCSSTSTVGSTVARLNLTVLITHQSTQ